MSLPFFHPRKSRARSGFSLVEMLVVMSIIAIMTGLGVAAFRGGSNGTGTSGAANAAYSMFGQARTQAIMRRTYAAVILDSDTSNAASTTLYRRIMTVYLDIWTTPATPVWKQASPWVTLPGNNYIDPMYSNPFGTIQPAINGGAGTYAYYAFDSTGQACLLPSDVSLVDAYLPTPSMPGSVNNKASTAAGQFVVSPGRMSSTTFVERDTHSRYGFYLFPLGRVAFFQDITDELSTAPSNSLQ